MAKPPKEYRPFLVHAAQAYGSNPKLLDQMAFLENGRKAVGVNNWDSNAAAGHPSQGMMQFIPSTFEAFSRKAVKANPVAWKGIKRDIGDWKAQLLTTAWAVENGLGSHWATYSRAQAAGGKKLAKLVKPWGATTGVAGMSGPAGAVAAATAPPGASPTSLSFNPGQRSALELVFKKSPFMQSLISQIPDTASVSVVRPAGPVSRVRGRRVADGVAGAAGGGGGAVGGSGAGSDIVQTAMTQVGKTANDAMKYIRAGGGTGYEPWCGDFVQWVFKQRGLKPPPARSVPRLLDWARKNERITKNPQPGDMVIFDWGGDGVPDHVEIVRNKIKGGVAAVGGNTSGPKGKSTVAAKDRTNGIMHYISATGGG